MKNVKIVLSACFILSIFSCKKKEENTCIGGAGGTVTIVAYPKHHGKPVRPSKIYIRYNSKDAPASTSNYDFTKNADTTEDHIEIENLKCGDYYIYAEGYDTSIKANVKGAIPYTIKEDATGEIQVNVPVTE